jgi:HSP20 family protein
MEVLVMHTARHDPVNALRRFQEEVDRLFGDELRARAGEDESRVVTASWTPAVDIKEEADCYVIIADVPGVEPADIEVTMESGVLTIRGERPGVSQVQGQVLRRAERVAGSFHRRFTMPDTADHEGVRASTSHGVLQVVIPKKSAVQPRRIEVR